MELTLEESAESLDLNKSFYMLDDLDVNLKENIEPSFEDAQLQMGNLSLGEQNHKTQHKNMKVTRFDPETLLLDSMDNLLQLNNCKKCKVCGKKKNVFEISNHEKKCKKQSDDIILKTDTKIAGVISCKYCGESFSKQSLLVQHIKTSKVCGNAIDGVHSRKTTCTKCCKTVVRRNFSRHLFQGHFRESSKKLKP